MKSLRLLALIVVCLVANSVLASLSPKDAFVVAPHGNGVSAIGVVQSPVRTGAVQEGPLVVSPLAAVSLGNVAPQNVGVGAGSVIFGWAATMKPAVAPADTDNLYFFFASPDDGGALTPWDSNAKAPRGPFHLTLGGLLSPLGEAGQKFTDGRKISYDLVSIDGSTLQHVLETAPNIGAAIVPDSADMVTGAATLLVAYPDQNKQMHVDAWWVPAQDAYSPVGQNLSLFTPTSVDSWDGNVSLATRIEADTQKTPIGVYLAMRIGPAIYIGSTRMAAPNPNVQSALPTVAWKTVSPADGLSDSSTAIVQRAADNRVFVNYVNAKGLPMQILVTNTNVQSGVSLAAPVALGSVPVTSVPSVAYMLGDATPPTTPYSSYTGVTETTVPVYRGVYYSAENAQYPVPQGNVTKYSTATRGALKPLPGTQKMLVGIIDGPPPIPVENIRAGNPTTNTPVGHTSFGQSKEQGSDSSYSIKGGPIVKEKASAGLGDVVGVTDEVEAKASFGRKTSTETSSSIISSYTAEAKTLKTNGTSELAAAGLAYVWGATFTGYRFTFNGPDNKPIPGAAEKTVIFPVAPQITVLPFDYDPNATAKGSIIPGELMSYVMDGDDVNALKNNSAFSFLNSKGSIDFAWAEGGSFSEEADQMVKNSVTTSWAVEVTKMVGATIETGVLNWEGSVGAFLNIESEETLSSTNRTTLATEVALPSVADGAPGAYTNYAYSVIPLKSNATYADQLVTLLKSHPTDKNTALLKTLVIDPANPSPVLGSPWKITYAIIDGNYHQNPAASSTHGKTSMAAQTPAAPPFPSSLKAKGITTPKQAALLYATIHHPQTMPLKGARADEAKRVSAAQSALSPKERADLATYIEASQKATATDFMKRHPGFQRRHYEPALPLVERPKAPMTLEFSQVHNAALLKATKRQVVQR